MTAAAVDSVRWHGPREWCDAVAAELLPRVSRELAGCSARLVWSSESPDPPVIHTEVTAADGRSFCVWISPARVWTAPVVARVCVELLGDAPPPLTCARLLRELRILMNPN